MPRAWSSVRCLHSYSPRLSWVIHSVALQDDAPVMIYQLYVGPPVQQTYIIIFLSQYWKISHHIKKKTLLAFIIDICWFFFSATTSKISTYITATCHPAASTIKPTKLSTPTAICGLLHHRLIACQSAGSGSRRLCRLKLPERKICHFLHRHTGYIRVCEFPCSIMQHERWHVLVSACTQSVPVLFCEKVPRWHLELGVFSCLCCFEGAHIVTFLCSVGVLSKTFNYSLSH